MTAPVTVTVPGDIPGLIQSNMLFYERGEPCVVLGIDPSFGGMIRVLLLRQPYRRGTVPLKLLSLDLSEPAGRDIAAWWMAEKVGMKAGLTAPTFYFDDIFGCWALCAIRGAGFEYAYFTSTECAPDARGWARIPGLPLDPDRGPEAMRAIVLHLAGRAP